MRAFYKFIGGISKTSITVQLKSIINDMYSAPVTQLYHTFLTTYYFDEIAIDTGYCAKGRACLLLQTPDSITEYHLVLYL